MLKKAKQAVLRGARALGAFQTLSQSQWRRNRLLILCYHSLSLDEEHFWRPPLFFRQEDLERRMRLLRKLGCTILPFQEAVDLTVKKALPPLSVAITFDDGTHDFYKLAAPVLSSLSIPATVYVTSYYSEAGKPIFHLMCHYLLWKGRQRTLGVDAELGVLSPIVLSTESARRAAYETITGFARSRRLTADEKDAIAGRLAAALGLDYSFLLEKRVLRIMTPGEVGQVAKAGFDVQLHTHRHRTPRDKDLFLREIRDNREWIQKCTGSVPRHFCYPSGVYYPEFLPWLRREGVQTATTCVPRLVTAQTELLLLPRLVDTCSLSDVEFEAWIAGAAALLPARS